MGRLKGTARAEDPTKNMKYPNRTLGGAPSSSGASSFARGATLAVLTAAAITGCAGGRWFDISPHGKGAQASTAAPADLRGSAVSYIQGLCALPREQRDSQVRGLNEALLPNHATISCGPRVGPVGE